MRINCLLWLDLKSLIDNLDLFYESNSNFQDDYITSCPTFEHDKYWTDDDIHILNMLKAQHSNKSSAQSLWAGSYVQRLTETVTGEIFNYPWLNSWISVRRSKTWIHFYLKFVFWVVWHSHSALNVVVFIGYIAEWVYHFVLTESAIFH